MFFFFNDTATTEIYTLSLHDALPISRRGPTRPSGNDTDPGETPPTRRGWRRHRSRPRDQARPRTRSEEHTSELQSRLHLVCRLLLEKKKNKRKNRQRCSRKRKVDTGW